jgi:hypothetical protein
VGWSPFAKNFLVFLLEGRSDAMIVTRDLGMAAVVFAWGLWFLQNLNEVV